MYVERILSKMSTEGALCKKRSEFGFIVLHTHITPEKTKVHVKTGTQIIDRFWQHLRRHLGTMKRKTGSTTLESRISSAQFTYWYKDQDLWLKTGDMLEALRQ